MVRMVPITRITFNIWRRLHSPTFAGLVVVVVSSLYSALDIIWIMPIVEHYVLERDAIRTAAALSWSLLGRS